ncbi:MAG: acyl-CoA dehydrogenase [Bacteroidota bacterium]
MDLWNTLHGALMGGLVATPLWAMLAGVVLVALVLGYVGAPLGLWAALGAVALVGFGAPVWLLAAFAALVVVFNVPPIRQQITRAVMALMDKLGFLPTISPTEKEAIDAGTVWVEGELFSGKPDFKKILAEDYPDLTDEERAFLEGPCEEVCEMAVDWDIMQRRDLPNEVWQKLKDDRFFGLIIPKEYGGLGLTPSANSAVVEKLAARSPALGITAMVPNSLGPAELLIHYGTQAQRDHYLPRLARGEDIPAFALTEPGAGSDAGAISSKGVLFKGDDGEIYLRLSWKKRYITLAAVSTVLGLAFKLEDPDNLLGKGKKLGITCALVPTDAPGVHLGERHDPLGIPFYNCPTTGTDVVVKAEEAIIGGTAGAGRGWRMLMECLSVGRGISLPSSSSGGAKTMLRVASAHAVNRKQFGLSIGKFEGIEEPLARIGGITYILEAARRYTNGGLDKGSKPSVVTAMMKYNATELYRIAINDAMDILGGNAISRGPRNTTASAYTNLPIMITVEGANILTRTLMIFGQGAIRCHPYALKEMLAVEAGDVKAFDRAFWAHIGHIVRNKVRAFVLSSTRGRLAGSPVSGPTAKYYRKLAWASASFAFLADMAMGTLGGNLKRKEKLTGRFADIFSWMYLGSAVLKRYEADGRRKEDLPFVHWSMQYALAQIQEAFDGLYANMEIPGATWLFRGPVAAWSRFNRLGAMPSDDLGQQVAQAIQRDGDQRERLSNNIYVSSDPTDALGRLEHAFRLVNQAQPVEKKLYKAIKAKQLPKKVHPAKLVAMAVEQGVILPEEADLLQRAEIARTDAIQVDHFSLAEYMATSTHPHGPAPEHGPMPVGNDALAQGDGASGDGAAVFVTPSAPTAS